MSGKYATTTTVPVEKTKAEIETVLRKYGATSFASGWNSTEAVIQFDAHGRRLSFKIPLPDPNDSTFTTYLRGKVPYLRTDTAALAEWEQACRSIWRSLLLLIKAMLEAVEAEIVVFEDAFLPYIVLPSGETVADRVREEVKGAYASGEITRRPLLALGSGNG